MRHCGLLATLGLLLAAVPALAVEDIEVPERAGFLHERTQIGFPASIGGMDRVWVRDFGSDQYDVAALYQTEDQATFLTVYVYRAGLPDVSLWFDRVASIMTAREGFHPARHASLEPAPYRPAGSDMPTGLALAYELAPGQPNTATGVILFPHGPWLIKLRATSSSMNAAELSMLLGEVERSLKRPEPQYLSAPAYLVHPCSGQLESGDTAIVEPVPGAVAAISVIMGGVAKSLNADGEEVPAPTPHWCRDEQVKDLNVYRPDDAPDRYVVAFGDSGNVLQVGIVMAQLPAATPKDRGISIIYADANRTMLMALVDRVPRPAAAWEMAKQASALGTADRNGHIQVTAGNP